MTTGTDDLWPEDIGVDTITSASELNKIDKDAEMMLKKLSKILKADL